MVNSQCLNDIQAVIFSNLATFPINEDIWAENATKMDLLAKILLLCMKNR